SDERGDPRSASERQPVDEPPRRTAMTTVTPQEVLAEATPAAVPAARRKIPSASVLFGVTWLVLLVVLNVTAKWIPSIREPQTLVTGGGNYAFGPGNDFWFGSDRLGRDVFARCIAGARISLIISVTSIVIGLVIGTILGMICGYFKG